MVCMVMVITSLQYAVLQNGNAMVAVAALWCCMKCASRLESARRSDAGVRHGDEVGEFHWLYTHRLLFFVIRLKSSQGSGPLVFSLKRVLRSEFTHFCDNTLYAGRTSL